MITANSYARLHERRYDRELVSAEEARIAAFWRAHERQRERLATTYRSEESMQPEPATPDVIHIRTPRDDTEAILARIAAKYGLTRAELMAPSHKHRSARARQEAMAELYGDGSNPGRSLPALGRLFQKHHTTILYGIREYRRRASNAQPVDPRETTDA